MHNDFINNDTICAPATSLGGAIAVVRVSGPKAIAAVDNLFSKDLNQCVPNSLTFGTLCDGPEILDEVVVALFRAPHSYTGEDSVEISCHASRYIVQRLSELLQANGCRMAAPGEFTQRAFLNGKIDLARAEAVADVIASSTQASHRMAMRQMRGHFSNALADLRDKLLHLCSLLELELDFSDHEDLTFANRDELTALASEAYNKVTALTESYSLGNVLKNGVPVAIIGQPNAGKSTLLNALIGEERAIVSDVRGTTRDAIEDTINIKGTLFRFVDTAGIQPTADKVEQLGIERTHKKIDEASIVLWVLDGTALKADFDYLSADLLPRLKAKQLVLLINKTDALPSGPTDVRAELNRCLAQTDESCIPKVRTALISAKVGTGIEDLKSLLLQIAGNDTHNAQDIIVSNARHFEALSQAAQALDRSLTALKSGVSADLVSEDLKQAIHHISEIIGDITSQDVLNNIFSKFCVGK